MAAKTPAFSPSIPRIKAAAAVIAALGFLFVGCSPADLPGDPDLGRSLYNQATIAGLPGCITCHNPEGDVVKVGPSHEGIAARTEQTLQDPTYHGAAEDVAGYLHESILEPDAFVREGYQPGIMVQSYGEVLSDSQINDLVAYLLTLE